MTALFLFGTGLLAGGFGALLGLGGGVIVIPILTMLFHMPIHTAIGISLVGVIATSTGAAVVYVREGKADIRLGMTLELGTTVGAIAGAVIAAFVSQKALYLIFVSMMLYNAYSMSRKNGPSGEVAVTSETNGNGGAQMDYKVKNVPQGVALSGLAGIMAGLLGVGGGMIKIPVMYILMGVPLKTAAATSNFMIGVTAAASAFIYFLNGSIDPVAAVPVALGVFTGALAGTRVNEKISTSVLKKIFVVLFLYTAVEMTLKGLAS